MSPAKARDIARTGIMSRLLLRRSHRSHHDQRNDEEKSGHQLRLHLPLHLRQSTRPASSSSEGHHAASVERRERMLQCDAGGSPTASHSRRNALRSVGGSDLFLLGGQVAVHHGAATAAQLGTTLHHAGGDLRDVRDIETAQVHICCASALKAKLEVDDSADSEAARARTKPAWRTVLVKDAVILGSHWRRSGGPISDGRYDAPKCRLRL